MLGNGDPTKMTTVLVTGASRGIGLEFVKQYARSGYSVIATCRTPQRANQLTGLLKGVANILVEPLDVSSDKSIQALKQLLNERAVTIDLLISNAGILINECFLKWNRDSFRETLDTNVVGSAMLVQSLNPFLSQSAKVVQLSSRLGSLDWGGKGMSDGDSYAISKVALNMLTVRLASIYEGSKRIAVSISPGWVATDMGGSGATLTVEDSVSKMIPTIDALTVSDSGRFIDSKGNSLPW